MRMIHLLLAAAHLLANAIGAASIASTDLAHLPFEVNALSGRL